MATTPSIEEALASPKQDVRCAGCGYGAVVRTLPEACPMCRGETWEPSAWRPFRHLQDVWPSDPNGDLIAAAQKTRR
jgi:hypothetical protein